MEGLPVGSDWKRNLEDPHLSVLLLLLNSLNFWGHAIRKGYNSFVFQELPSPTTAGCSSTKNKCKQQLNSVEIFMLCSYRGNIVYLEKRVKWLLDHSCFLIVSQFNEWAS